MTRFFAWTAFLLGILFFLMPLVGMTEFSLKMRRGEYSFDAYRAVKPFLITSGNPPTKERIQSATDRARFDDTTKCILCAACTTSCPVFWSDGQYFGPQAIVGAHRFIFDSRDAGTDLRLDILNSKEGVWRCRTTFNCTEACPRGIEVTKAIQALKGEVTLISVAHRLSTIKNYDQICYLDDGRIISKGTFSEVATKLPAFAEQVSLAGLAGEVE